MLFSGCAEQKTNLSIVRYIGLFDVALQYKYLYNKHSFKEKTMFTFQSVLDNAVKGAKSSLSYVQDKEVRTNLETVIDANADFANVIYQTNLTFAKLVVEKMGTSELTKPFADAAKKFVAEVK